MKEKMRAAARERRDLMDPAERRSLSAIVARRAIDLLGIRQPACLAAYVAIRSECDPGDIRRWAHERGIQLALPATDGRDRMVFRRHMPGGDLEDGGFGTRQPPRGMPIVTPDVIVAPLLAFDRKGGRLGYGRGYYDRAIAEIDEAPPLLLGVAFSVQEIAVIPRERHDLRLDLVATELETVDCLAER